MDYSNLFVCLLGICTVFIGLICIIILVSIMSGIVRKTDKKAQDREAASASSSQTAAPAQIPASGAGEVTPELVAAVSAAIAEETGTDINAIRILSFKRV